MPKFSFIPREEKFFDLFEEDAKNVVKASQVLKELVDDWEDIEAKVDLIDRLEHTGDNITHEIMARLHRTFVTPFDREDIALLAHSLDDIVDLIHAAATAMILYKVERPGEKARELADIIVQTTTEVDKAISQLHLRRAELRTIFDRCVEINRLENLADVVFRSAVAELFENSKDATHIIKWREIFEHMEGATDRCEDVSDVLEGVVLKHA